MPVVRSLAHRQQVSLGVLLTAIAFHLGLKTMDAYPKVPHIKLIDRVFLLTTVCRPPCAAPAKRAFCVFSNV